MAYKDKKRLNLIPIWWHKNITKNRNYNSEHFAVWCRSMQIPTREINKTLSTEMDVLRSARKSRMERIKLNI